MASNSRHECPDCHVLLREPGRCGGVGCPTNGQAELVIEPIDSGPVWPWKEV